jgi:cytochrome c556
MRRVLTAAVIGLMCMGGAAAAHGDAAPSGGPADIVRARQAAMMMSGATVGAMKGGIDAGQAPSTQRFAARALSRWAHALPGLFPEGTDAAGAGIPSDAKPEVWSDRAGFEAKAAQFAAAADRLAELSGGEDAAAFSAQWTVVRAGCQSCHDGYKN